MMLWDQNKLASGFIALKKAEFELEVSLAQGADHE